MSTASATGVAPARRRHHQRHVQAVHPVRRERAGEPPVLAAAPAEARMIVPSTATPKVCPSWRLALWIADAMPACSAGTAARAVIVIGGSAMPAPAPKSASAHQTSPMGVSGLKPQQRSVATQAMPMPRRIGRRGPVRAAMRPADRGAQRGEQPLGHQAKPGLERGAALDLLEVHREVDGEPEERANSDGPAHVCAHERRGVEQADVHERRRMSALARHERPPSSAGTREGTEDRRRAPAQLAGPRSGRT